MVKQDVAERSRYGKGHACGHSDENKDNKKAKTGRTWLCPLHLSRSTIRLANRRPHSPKKTLLEGFGLTEQFAMVKGAGAPFQAVASKNQEKRTNNERAQAGRGHRALRARADGGSAVSRVAQDVVHAGALGDGETIGVAPVRVVHIWTFVERDSEQWQVGGRGTAAGGTGGGERGG